tara:strand:- start:20299 stop:20439 length:141 start_codon:yes stop_codon:yes gene_type:complete
MILSTKNSDYDYRVQFRINANKNGSVAKDSTVEITTMPATSSGWLP